MQTLNYSFPNKPILHPAGNHMGSKLGPTSWFRRKDPLVFVHGIHVGPKWAVFVGSPDLDCILQYSIIFTFLVIMLLVLS